jgi:putative FmdB family regulatory protein
VPLFEFECNKCGYRFEKLVLGSDQPACPQCDSVNLEKVFSSFAVSRGSSSGMSASAASGNSCGAGFGSGG